MHELRLPDRPHRLDEVLKARVGIVEADLPQEGRGAGLVPDVRHHEDVVLLVNRPRDASPRRGHPEEVLVLLLGPRVDDVLAGPPHVPEPRIPDDVVRDVLERRVADPINLQGEGAAIASRRMEHVPLLPRGHWIVHGREDAVIDHLREQEEGPLIEHLVVRLPLVRVPHPMPPRVDLPLELLEGVVIKHSLERWGAPP